MVCIEGKVKRYFLSADPENRMLACDTPLHTDTVRKTYVPREIAESTKFGFAYLWRLAGLELLKSSLIRILQKEWNSRQWPQSVPPRIIRLQVDVFSGDIFFERPGLPQSGRSKVLKIRDFDVMVNDSFFRFLPSNQFCFGATWKSENRKIVCLGFAQCRHSEQNRSFDFLGLFGQELTRN